MADHKPAPEDRKSSYVAPLVIAAIAIALIAVITVRVPSPTNPSPSASTAKTTAAKPQPAPVPAAAMPPGVLTRNDLVEGDRQLATAYADTGKLPEGADPLIGRRFSLRIAFGCNGFQSETALSQASVSYDANNQSITLTAQPGSWISLPQIQALSNFDEIEAVDGFWIPRPWAEEEGCPQPISYPVPATPTPPTAQTLGLAQIFLNGASRVGEHADKPYAFTRKLPADGSALLSHSYRLLLQGVISGFADGRALHCSVEGPDHAPVCLYAVNFDHVALEDGDTGEVLANWTN